MNSILFVCSANMCRSPMAEALFSNLLVQRDSLEDWYVSSAGVWAIEGSRAAEGVVKALRRLGIDISFHRAQPVSRELVINSNLILVMERNHKEALQSVFPQAADKIYMLTEMVGQSHDIRDPIGGTPADYDDTAAELENLLITGYDQIQQLVLMQKDARNQ